MTEFCAGVLVAFLAPKFVSLYRWYFVVNRDGDSGRYRHWSEE